MQRFQIYLTEEQDKKVSHVARVKGEPKAEVIRSAIDAGLVVIEPKSTSAQALLNLARAAEKVPTEGNVPEDAVEQMDYYLWGGEKRE